MVNVGKYTIHGSYGVDAGKCIDVVEADTIKIPYDEEDGGAFLIQPFIPGPSSSSPHDLQTRCCV